MAGHGPSAAQVLGRVTLVTGKEEYLSARTVSAVRHAIRAHDAEAEVADSPGGTLTLATLDDMSSPSLFSTTRCVIVTALEDTPDDVADALVDYAAAPSDDVALVLVHSGGAKGSGVLTRLRKQAAVTEVKSPEVKYARDFVAFVTAEFAAQGARATPEAADFLVQAVGQDLRSLSAATHQLGNDFPDQQIGIDEVKRYFGGRAEAKSFAVADHAFAGRAAPVGARGRHRHGAGDLRVRGRRPRDRPLPRGRQGAPGGRPGPRAGSAAVEGQDDPRPVARLDRPGHRRRRASRGHGRRRHQGSGARRGLHPGAAGAHRHRPAKPALTRPTR
jgi:hypothetical protein